MAEVEIDGVTYNIGRLNAFQQWDLGRKILPFLPAILPALRLAERDLDPANFLVELSEALKPIAEVLSAMSQADSNFVLNLCLEAVRRRGPDGNFRPVRAAGPFDQPGLLMFEQEMDFTVLLRLAWEVINSALGPGLRARLSAESAAQPNGSGTGALMTGISGSRTA